jgi:AcrR family transcriptional regulator
MSQDEPSTERLTQEQRRDHARAKLLAVATELFSENGYHRTQVMDIVTKARVSAATFYRYFDDKQAIFCAIAEALAAHEVEEARKARAMIAGATDFGRAVRDMVQSLERHFERAVQHAALYRALHNSGVVDAGRDHLWAMRERAVAAMAEELAKTGPKDTEDLESLARMVIGVTTEMRSALIYTGKPTPARAARLVTRFLQGAMVAYSTQDPRFAKVFNSKWRDALDHEAKT